MFREFRFAADESDRFLATQQALGDIYESVGASWSLYRGRHVESCFLEQAPVFVTGEDMLAAARTLGKGQVDLSFLVERLITLPSGGAYAEEFVFRDDDWQLIREFGAI